MSQTVEFEYAIGETVVITENGPARGCLGIVEARTQNRTGMQYDVAYPGDMSVLSYTNRHWFDPRYLKRRAKSECAPSSPTPAPPTPAPTFPRVIWQGTLEDDACYRIVHMRPKELVVEKRYRDVLGGASWNSITWGDHSWSRSIAQALLAHEAKVNGSDQNP